MLLLWDTQASFEILAIVQTQQEILKCDNFFNESKIKKSFYRFVDVLIYYIFVLSNLDLVHINMS